MIKKILSFDNIPIRYLIKKGEKECVLFLHGVGGGYQCWKPIYNYLHEKGHSVIALDLRSHGKSGKPIKNNCNMLSIIKDINLILNKEGINKISLVGHSYGTFVAINYYSKFKEKVSNIVLMGSHHNPAKDNSFKYGLNIFMLIPKILSLFYKKDKFFEIDFSKYKGRSDYDIPKICKEIISVTPYRYINFASEMSKFNYKDYVDDIKIPLLLIHGTIDICVNKKIPYEFNSEVSNSRLIYYKGINHHTPVNCPDDIRVSLFDFFTSYEKLDENLQKRSLINEEKVFLINPL